jgi:hypothetical protein
MPEKSIEWPQRPHVLFAFAAPQGFEAVPSQAHLLALRQALAPWLDLSDAFDPETSRQLVAGYLSVLPHVTVAQLERACAENDFTHVHLLAHGVEIETPYDRRFGLVLHSDTAPGGRELVSGDRLASIVRTPRRGQPGRFTRPAVVTLASCNSGNVGTVTGVGASIGHALHEAGIPLVVASQYPLSFAGSVILVQELYGGLLLGDDPRKLLVGLRRRLHSRLPEQHDWASIVAYASLPPDFEKDLANASIRLAMSSINAANDLMDDLRKQL